MELAAEEMKRWAFLDDNLKKERITAEEQTVYSHVFDYTNRMICLLCPMELNAKKSGKKYDEYEAVSLYFWSLFTFPRLSRFVYDYKFCLPVVETYLLCRFYIWFTNNKLVSNFL